MMKKVLWFVDRLLVGGIQTLLINLAEHIDKNEWQVDFLLLDDGEHYKLEDYLIGKGYNVYKLNGVWIRKPIDYINYSKRMDTFFFEHHDYTAVHMNSGSKNFPVLYYAKKYGIEKRVAHSHNIGFQTKSSAKIFIGNVLKYPLKKYANIFLGCSKNAGEWLFGKKITQGDNFYIIKNGININKFKFSQKIRNAVRNELSITDDKIVVGHVGRFAKQKNHTFLIDVFNELVKKNDKYVLLLIGTGELQDEIKMKVNRLNLQNNVMFLGFKNNVSDYLQAMDIFVFPSEYEGLGIGLIEAQTTGLPCFTSADVIPKEAQVTPLLEYIPLDSGAKKWADKVMETKIDRCDCSNLIKKAGYDICDVTQQLCDIYLK